MADFNPNNPDPNSPEYAAWYNTLPFTTRAYVAAPGSASANYQYQQGNQSRNNPNDAQFGPGSSGSMYQPGNWQYQSANPLARPNSGPPATNGANPLGRSPNPTYGQPPGNGTPNTGLPPPPGTQPPPPGAPVNRPKAGAPGDTPGTAAPYSLNNPLNMPQVGQSSQGFPSVYSDNTTGNSNFTAPQSPGAGIPSLAGAGRTVGNMAGTGGPSMGSSMLGAGMGAGNMPQPTPWGSPVGAGSGVGSTKPMEVAGGPGSNLMTGDTLTQLLGRYTNNQSYQQGFLANGMGQGFDPWAQSRQMAAAPGYNPNTPQWQTLPYDMGRQPGMDQIAQNNAGRNWGSNVAQWMSQLPRDDGLPQPPGNNNASDPGTGTGSTPVPFYLGAYRGS